MKIDRKSRLMRWHNRSFTKLNTKILYIYIYIIDDFHFEFIHIHIQHLTTTTKETRKGNQCTVLLAKVWNFSSDSFVLYTSPLHVFSASMLLILGVLFTINFVHFFSQKKKKKVTSKVPSQLWWMSGLQRIKFSYKFNCTIFLIYN